ncbi:hypothetical protein SLS59_007083 [Nothophoma quercina]|uniref:NB-ARC domain-containing protein n=1 Tax=Nothophoma quercina TaxID=749835 RepID=A0ABR3R0Z0_9PLEO
MTSATTFGNDNDGFQAGTIHGPVHNTFHFAPAPLETLLRLSIVIPFARDADFVERGTLLDDIRERCAPAGARIALVGLGGVGKSQLAIEHAYRTRKASPETWVLWAHGSSAARLEQSFRDITNRVKVAGRQDPQANIFKLVHDWLCDSKERWLLVLDNVDNAGFLLEAQGAGSKAAGRPLREYLPHCERGSILVTSRNEEAALKLVEQCDLIALCPMSEGQAQSLLEKKLSVRVAQEAQEDDRTTAELAAALECMPLAIVQAAAYISQRAPLCLMAKYLDEYRKSEPKRTSLLNRDEGQLRRDQEAKNSIITTWQILFEHIQRARPSAADLLSLMSFFDRQGIPKSVLQRPAKQDEGGTSREDYRGGVNSNEGADRLQSDHADNGYEDGSEDDYEDDFDDDFEDDTKDDSDEDELKDEAFQDDVTALRNFSFISINTDGTGFEMHTLVQLATRTWLAANDQHEQ